MMRTRRQCGAALLIAMLLAALVAAVTVGLATGQERWRATVEQRRDQVQATALAQAGIQWARQVLEEDARSSTIDHLGEVWALPLPRTPLNNGSIEGRIIDAQGLLNLNNLAADDSTAIVERAHAAALFTTLGLPASALEAIADAIDHDTAPREGGAEDAAYASALPPRMAPNQPALRLAELASVRGLNPAAITLLAPYATVLAPPTQVNVNTAPTQVLAALLPTLDDDGVEALVAGRARKPYTTLAEFRARLPEGVAAPDERTISVSSSYFLVTVIAHQGATIARGRALLRRAPGTRPAVVWQVIA